jgi:hypothetical protein
MRPAAPLLAISLTIVPSAHAESTQLTAATYADGSSKGIVLFDVDWGRYGRCGGFESAQLRQLAFELLSSGAGAPGSNVTLDLEGSTIPLFDRRGLQNFGAVVTPGKYAMTRIAIRVTKSQSEIGEISLDKSHLLRDGVARAGTFTVNPGEIVYIGNFKVDCAPPMTLWRYYTEGRENFAKHVLEYKREFPFLDVERIQYRLFETTTIGRPYELN